jgi:hypothetical protein
MPAGRDLARGHIAHPVRGSAASPEAVATSHDLTPHRALWRSRSDHAARCAVGRPDLWSPIYLPGNTITRETRAGLASTSAARATACRCRPPVARTVPIAYRPRLCSTTQRGRAPPAGFWPRDASCACTWRIGAGVGRPGKAIYAGRDRPAGMAQLQRFFAMPSRRPDIEAWRCPTTSV